MAAHLGDWHPPGTLRSWPLDELVPGHVQDIWCRPTPTTPWALQVMLDGTSDGEWTYHRDPRIRRLLEALAGTASTSAYPVLALAITTPTHPWRAALQEARC